ncbi:hypothetical protein KFE25_010553 [Diacronema lutheri]|uniref:Peptidase S54 rhomboid domain-containing protein n=2 Tax=Diacronema lutheri TaxID=2081491 RepID=A0A8J5X5B8_DIALT|nr:hypothetical protein KFE25_010553 [Diacronema lutheri]
MAVDRRACALILGALVLHHTRPHVATLGLRASIANWPAQFASHLARPPRLEWRGSPDRNVDDLVLCTVRFSKRRAHPTHVGVLGAWIRLPMKDLSIAVILVTSTASFAAYQFRPTTAFKFFTPPHAGFARPASFVLAPFAQHSLMGLIFCVIAALSCGPELERRPGSAASALSLFVLCGMLAHAVGTRLFDDRGAASCSSNGARLGWLAALAARRPGMKLSMYGVEMNAWLAVALNAALAAGEGGGGGGTVAGLASAVALGAAAGHRLG